MIHICTIAFLLYMNTMVEVPSALLPILYADDISLFIFVFIRNVNTELTKVLE